MQSKQSYRPFGIFLKAQNVDLHSRFKSEVYELLKLLLEKIAILFTDIAIAI